METFIHLLLALIALPVFLAGVYLAVLTLLSWRAPAPRPSDRNLRFDILVPAHNEASVIARTVASLRNIDWPESHRRIIVVADNCNDDTAERAQQAGASVIVRHDDARRGKGYALEYGITHSAADDFADAVVVVDADTTVTPNLLSAFAARLERGAQAAQAHYGVLNPDDSWRTRLVTIAYGAFHAVRSRARERMKVSCGLRGNGMCLTHALLRQHRFSIYSMTEDLEYGIILGLNGIRVHYVDEASADAELVSSGQASRSQRQRWESGRLTVMRQYAGPLLKRGIFQRNALCLELALDLLTLPLGYIALQILALMTLAGLASIFFPSALGWLALGVALIIVLLLHVLRGWQLSPLGPRALLDLCFAPFFIVWKLYVLIRDRKNRSWIRTNREP